MKLTIKLECQGQEHEHIWDLPDDLSLGGLTLAVLEGIDATQKRVVAGLAVEVKAPAVPQGGFDGDCG